MGFFTTDGDTCDYSFHNPTIGTFLKKDVATDTEEEAPGFHLKYTSLE